MFGSRSFCSLYSSNLLDFLQVSAYSPTSQSDVSVAFLIAYFCMAMM